MKTLSTEQQIELRKVLEDTLKLYQGLMTTPGDMELKNQLTYWCIELKPKRVRKLRSSEDGADAPKKNIMDGDGGTSMIESDGGTRFIDGGTTFVENSIDNPVAV